MTNNRKENGRTKVSKRREHRGTHGPRGPPRHFFEITAGITTAGSKNGLLEITTGITTGG